MEEREFADRCQEKLWVRAIYAKEGWVWRRCWNLLPCKREQHDIRGETSDVPSVFGGTEQT